jgi:hypothetical protein
MIMRGDVRRLRPLRALALPLLALALTASASAGQCSRRFDQLTTGLPDACVFVGTYNVDCGGEAVALFAGDGSALVVSLSPSATAPPLFIAAQALSATEGKVVLWRPDLQLEAAPPVGSVRLEDDGRRLVLRLQPGLMTAGGCPLREFVGRFAGMAAAADEPPARPVTQPIAAVDAAALPPR